VTVVGAVTSLAGEPIVDEDGLGGATVELVHADSIIVMAINAVTTTPSLRILVGSRAPPSMPEGPRPVQLVTSQRGRKHGSLDYW
jgi:hypothetical protein